MKTCPAENWLARVWANYRKSLVTWEQWQMTQTQSDQKALGNAFEDFTLRFLERFGCRPRLTRSQPQIGWSGNQYEIDIMAQMASPVPLEACNYLVECKFSIPTAAGRFLPERPRQPRGEILEFFVKGVELSRALKQPLYGLFVTNRQPDANTVRFANAYGIVLLAPEYPPLPALPALLSFKGIVENEYMELAWRVRNWLHPRPFDSVYDGNVEAVNYAYFTIYRKLAITPAVRLLK
ncbi:hypothetical protein HYR99_13515 [Candidatus Poribacteria bacterium]|nr:hypothetical protein [Candidatus Poribacteria bacterium]